MATVLLILFCLYWLIVFIICALPPALMSWALVVVGIWTAVGISFAISEGFKDIRTLRDARGYLTISDIAGALAVAVIGGATLGPLFLMLEAFEALNTKRIFVKKVGD